MRWPVGGIRTFTQYVYNSFDPRQWKFTIIAPYLGETQLLLDSLCAPKIHYIPVYGMPTDGSSGIGLFSRTVASIIFSCNFDLVHSHGFISGMSSALPSFLRGIPHLMTSHDVINKDQFAGIKGSAKRFAMALCLTLIDKIHSVSNDAQNNLYQYFPHIALRRKKGIVISNGIDTSIFLKESNRNLKQELSLEDDCFLIGFFGRFMAQKGFRYLVDAIKILKDKESLPGRPIVLAFGEGAFINEDIKMVRALGLEGSIKFMPLTNNVAAAIKGVDVVVMPSLWEACGLLAMETLACGVPLIASDCIGLREVLKNTPAKMVSPADSYAIAKALEQEMVKDTKNHFKIFSSIACERFDISHTISSLETLYVSMTK